MRTLSQATRVRRGAGLNVCLAGAKAEAGQGAQRRQPVSAAASNRVECHSIGKDGVWMSSPKESWLDRWWPLLLILFGIACVVILDVFHPMH